MDFPSQCGAAAVADRINTEKLKSVCLILYIFVRFIITYTVSAGVEVGLA